MPHGPYIDYILVMGQGHFVQWIFSFSTFILECDFLQGPMDSIVSGPGLLASCTSCQKCKTFGRTFEIYFLMACAGDSASTYCILDVVLNS